MLSSLPLLEDTTSLAITALVGAAALAFHHHHQQQQRARAAASRRRLLNGREAREPHALDSTLPLLGNVLDYLKYEPVIFDWFTRNSLQFGGAPWKLTVPGQGELVFFSTPEAIEDITVTQFDKFPKGPFQRELLHDLLGRSIISADGDYWYELRKVAQPFFAAKPLRVLMTDVMHRNTHELYACIDASIASDTLVDLRELFMSFTIDTFVAISMGVHLDCIRASDRATSHPFLEAMNAVGPAIATRFLRPKWLWKLQRALNLGPERVVRESMGVIRSWLQQTIDQCLQQSVEKQKQKQQQQLQSESHQSLVEMLLLAERGDAMDADELVDFLLAFIIAARDTTADTLSWMFYLLGRNPEIAQKLRDEMTVKLAPADDSDVDGDLTIDHIKELTYLEAVIKETLRLYPSAPYLTRVAAEDTVVCGDVPIRKGQLIGLLAFAMGRNPDVWGDDASTFRPERWIDAETGQLKQAASSKFFTFGHGPRICIGMHLAMLELRVVAANLLNRYNFELDTTSNDGSYKVATTLEMKHPLLMRATRRV
ncbi:hypothetical protein PINS_up000731 [Pythium insidiosum]|nr:hypothetical protein PINS_up000731 [Pythium insidiosum]